MVVDLPGACDRFSGGLKGLSHTHVFFLVGNIRDCAIITWRGWGVGKLEEGA